MGRRYEFMSTGRVRSDHPDLQNDPEDIIKSIGLQNINHKIKLASVYKEVTGSEPKFTNYTDHYTGCLDYIWVSSSLIVPAKVSVLPSESEIESCGDMRLPNPKYPSDHLALDCTVLISPSRYISYPRSMLRVCCITHFISYKFWISKP